MESQFEELAQNPDIIIATPGRLIHHLSEVDDMSLKTVEYVVFDEADCLFGMGFAEQSHKILTQLSENRQTLLFSATLPRALAEFAKAGLRDPHLVRLDLETRISPDLKLTFFTLRPEEKYAALIYLIREQISSDQQTLIFVSTKHHLEFLNVLFREEVIEPSICYGQAARAGRTGTAFSFVTFDDMPYILDLNLFLSKPIWAAPTEEKVLQDMDGVMSNIDDAVANGETVYRLFPQIILNLVSDRIQETIDSCGELIALQKACTNAFRLYSKTTFTI
ncbi:hypothetical protein QYF36_007021 [Acer negundo]|nr:hypothetical protein QYF36_007021 [Acer negundo]